MKTLTRNKLSTVPLQGNLVGLASATFGRYGGVGGGGGGGGGGSIYLLEQMVNKVVQKVAK